MLSHSQLLASATAFCDALAQKKDLDTILSLFSSTGSAIEHGESALVPYFGRLFEGLDNIRAFFESAASLGYDRMNFSEFTVDTEAGRVAYKGQAKFTWIETGESWDETHASMLDFDDAGKITKFQGWPDTGSVYLARIGKLTEVREAGNTN